MRDVFMKQATVVAACAGYAAYCLFVGSAGIRTSPDSVFYLDFSPIVPTGYSVFLTLLSLQGAVIVQPILFASALAWLGLESLRAWSSLPLALSAMAGCIAVPELASIHASVLTESLFMSCEVAVMATMVRFTRLAHWPTLAIGGVIGGVASMVRNAGYIFLPVLVVLALVHWRRLGSSRLLAIASIVVPMAAAVAAERAIAHAVHGDQTTSLLGRHLFAKAALIEAPRAATAEDSVRRVLNDRLENDFSRIRQTLETAPPAIQSLLAVYYETCLQGPCTREMRDSSISALPEAQQNAILADVAIQRIARAPLNFVRLTLMHYASLWVAYKQAHPDTTPILNEFLSSHRPLPYEALALSWRDPSQPLRFEADARVRYLQPAVLAIAWITGALAVVAIVSGVARRRLPPLVAVASLAALTAHAGVLFSATFAPGISRFTVSFWPAVMASLVFAFWSMVWWGKGLRQGSA